MHHSKLPVRAVIGVPVGALADAPQTDTPPKRTPQNTITMPAQQTAQKNSYTK